MKNTTHFGFKTFKSMRRYKSQRNLLTISLQSKFRHKNDLLKSAIVIRNMINSKKYN